MTQTDDQQRTVAVLGIGTMGAGMARQLQAHGHGVRAWNRSPDKAAPLADDGITVCTEPAEAVRGADVVVLMVFDAQAAIDVLEQAASGLTEETVVMQSTTVGLDIAKIAEVADRLGVRLLDAPVLGTKKPAEDGMLTVLASGDPTLREIADPVFDAVGARTLWVGDEVGLASRLKLACNAWIGAVAAGIGQSIALSEGLGLDPQLFLDAVGGSAVDAPYVQLKGRAMISGAAFDEDSVSFAVDGVSKDLRLIEAALEECGVSTDLVSAVRGLFERASASGHGSEDMAAVRAAF